MSDFSSISENLTSAPVGQTDLIANSAWVIGTPIYKTTGANQGDVASAASISTSATLVGLATNGGTVNKPSPFLPYGLLQLSLAQCNVITGQPTSGPDVGVGLTPGAVYYLSTTAGLIQDTKPTGTGHVVLKVGIALTATSLLINIGDPTVL